MKKILILTYHFEPLNVIASQRALGYANHFKKFGFEPTIISHNWKLNEEDLNCKSSSILKKVEIEKNNKFTIYRIPIGNFKISKFLSLIEKSSFNKFGVFFSWLFGHLDTSNNLLNCYLTEKHFLKNHLKSNKYDIVLGIFSPHYHHKNCRWINNKYKIPYILDYRDLWSNRIIHLDYKPNLTEKIQDFFSIFWWKKWSKNSLFNTITSEPWKNKLIQTNKKNGFVITNGFEKSFFENTNSTKNNKVFKIVHNGSLYRHQNHEIFFKGVKLFIEKTKPSHFIIEFVGAKRYTYTKGINSFIDPNEIEHGIDAKYISFSERIPYVESINNILESQILYFPTFPYSKGTYAGKIFEYLGAKRNILAAPKDNDVIDKLLLETKAGVSLNTAIEVANFIEEKYNEWLQNGFCFFNGDKDEISKYSRESQTERLSNLIKDALK